MSYDLVFWRGRPLESPRVVWQALQQGKPIAFMMPITRTAAVAAFRREFGDDLQIDEASGEVLGRGWEFMIEDEARYLYVMCSWELPNHPDRIERLRRAGAYAGCSMFDPQTMQFRESSAFPETSAPESARARVVLPPSPAGPRLGDRVHHERFGEGVVLGIEGHGPMAKARIRFEAGEKVVLVRMLAERPAT